MKKTLLIAMMVFFCGFLFAQEKIEKDPEKVLIMQTIETAYVEGLQNEGDTVKINKGFHPSFDLLIPEKDGTLKKYSLSEWKSKIQLDLASGKLPRKPQEQVSIKFLTVDVTGNAAMAKFEFYVGTRLTFIDYQFLYKFGEEWKIVSKIYHRF
jgi:hypothetical protein